jgi:hypothetical protein
MFIYTLASGRMNYDKLYALNKKYSEYNLSMQGNKTLANPYG